METVQPTYTVAINAYPEKGELTALFAGESQTSPGHRVGPQVLDYYLVHHITRGRGRFTCRGTVYELSSGSSFFIPPGELVSYESDETDPWAYRWVGLRGVKAEELLSRIGRSAAAPVIAVTNPRRIAIQYVRLQRALSSDDAAGAMEASGWLRALFAEYWRASPSSVQDHSGQTAIKRQIDQAIRWLNLQYAQPVSIEQMAQALGYHRTHLSKMFKECTGQSPSQFLLQLRMDRARQLMGEPLSVEQIASSVGFADPLYFSKQFKKRFGCSPTAFREQLHLEDRYCY